MKVKFTLKNEKGEKVRKVVETSSNTLFEYIHLGNMKSETITLTEEFPDYYIIKIEDADK